VSQAAHIVDTAHRCWTGPIQQPNPVSGGRPSRLTVRSNEFRRVLRPSRDVTQSVADRSAGGPGRRARLPSSRVASPRPEPHHGLSSSIQ